MDIYPNRRCNIPRPRYLLFWNAYKRSGSTLNALIPTQNASIYRHVQCAQQFSTLDRHTMRKSSVSTCEKCFRSIESLNPSGHLLRAQNLHSIHLGHDCLARFPTRAFGIFHCKHYKRRCRTVSNADRIARHDLHSCHIPNEATQH